jgi:hypothetical protein
MGIQVTIDARSPLAPIYAGISIPPVVLPDGTMHPTIQCESIDLTHPYYLVARLLVPSGSGLPDCLHIPHHHVLGIAELGEGAKPFLGFAPQ